MIPTALANFLCVVLVACVSMMLAWLLFGPGVHIKGTIDLTVGRPKEPAHKPASEPAEPAKERKRTATGVAPAAAAVRVAEVVNEHTPGQRMTPTHPPPPPR
jgi:hypothetical protein